MPNTKILVVDDDSELREAVTEQLSMHEDGIHFPGSFDLLLKDRSRRLNGHTRFIRREWRSPARRRLNQQFL